MGVLTSLPEKFERHFFKERPETLSRQILEEYNFEEVELPDLDGGLEA